MTLDPSGVEFGLKKRFTEGRTAQGASESEPRRLFPARVGPGCSSVLPQVRRQFTERAGDEDLKRRRPRPVAAVRVPGLRRPLSRWASNRQQATR